MKLIDDKLKIIDDVPTSAVEMAVKEKVPILFYFMIVLTYGNKSNPCSRNFGKILHCQQD